MINKTIYPKENFKKIGIVIFFTLLVYIARLIPPTDVVAVLNSAIIYLPVVAILSASVLWGNSIVFKEQNMIFTNLFRRKKIPIEQITKIVRSPSFKGIPSAGKSIFVFFKSNGQERIIEIPEHAYGSQVVREIIELLTRKNNSIRLEETLVNYKK